MSFFGQCSQCNAPAGGVMDWNTNRGHSYGVCVIHAIEKAWTIKSFDSKGRLIDYQISWGEPQDIQITVKQESGGFIEFS